MIRRAVFVAGVAAEGEKPLWERDLEFWAKGLNNASFDRIVACVLDGELSFTPDGVDVRNARHTTIEDTITECANGLGDDDELWLVISNHGDCVPTRASGFATATPNRLFSLFDMNRAIGRSKARQVVIAGQCGAGHFYAKPPPNRVVLAACGYMQFAGRILTHSTHNEWLLLVGLALFPRLALDLLSSDEVRWRDAAEQLSAPISLEVAFNFAKTHTVALNPRHYPKSNDKQQQQPQLAGSALATTVYL